MSDMLKNETPTPSRQVMLVFGTRPEAIKMCPLVLALKDMPTVDCRVCVTGQHKEMLDAVLEAFHVVPDYDLSVMKAEQTLADITVGVLTKVTAVLREAQPDIVLVHGDTTTSFAVALAAFYLGIMVGHVESGLRTYNMKSPFPEEFNREAVDMVTSLHFAPTSVSRDNLLKEGRDPERIWVTGNTGIDALHTTVRKDYSHPELDWAEGSRLLLVTAHRRENLGDPMRQMLRGIRRVVESHADVKALYPVHLNPKVREVAYEELGDCDRIHLIEPLDTLDFHNIMARSYLVLTDSGGIQEEAPSLGKPVLVMRDATERPEGVMAGTLKLVGAEEEAIVRECSRLLNDDRAYVSMARAVNPYGDGKASKRIAEVVASYPII